MKIVAMVLLVFSGLAFGESDTQEMLLASEGGPDHITDDASFMKFENGKFVYIKRGTNNFTCLVMREPKGRFEPACLNAEAMRSVFPTYQLNLNLLYSGHSYDETYQEIEKRFKEGQIPTAEAGALVYMMSPNNRRYIPSSDSFVNMPPHQMYFYPKLTNETFSLKSGPPWLYQGFPHMSVLIVVPNEP